MIVSRPYRSKLTPFEEEIASLRRTRPPTPYSEIVRLLKDRHGLTVQVSTLFNFVKVRRKWDRLQRLAARLPLPTITRGVPTQPRPQNQRYRSAPCSETTPVHPVKTVPRSINAPLPRQNPRGRTMKSFIPSAEYNLERLTPEQMAEWLAELKREQGG
jgi:hypothetical protein